MAVPTQTKIPDQEIQNQEITAQEITAQEAPAAKITASSARQGSKPSGSAEPAGAAGLRAVSGLLDVGGNGSAFVRTSGFRIGPDDVFVSAALIKQYALRRGDQIVGAARQPGSPAPARNGQSRDSAARNGQARNRDPHPALARVDTVNGLPAAQATDRPDFDTLTPLYPDQRIRLEAGSASATSRIIDLVSPIGLGQRGLIVSPPKAGKTLVLKEIATAISASHPEAHLMMVLVGERPEEVTDLRRSVPGEIFYSTFDDSAQDHIMVAELAIERAKRLVELGRDVVVLLDSITRLARAYNIVAPSTSRILAGGVATSALQPPRKFLGAARNVEFGGSLTILSTALIDTGSRMDDVFFEEFKGTGNMELRLRRDLAERRLFPAVDVAASGTRHDELLLLPDEYAATGELRRGLSGLEASQALELLLDRTRETATNAEFLRQIRGTSLSARR
ncbi:MAG: transcription termination factor Rho [Streptosporangiaceae bacterium]